MGSIDHLIEKLIEKEFSGDIQDEAKRIFFTANHNPRLLGEVIDEIAGIPTHKKGKGTKHDEENEEK